MDNIMNIKTSGFLKGIDRPKWQKTIIGKVADIYSGGTPSTAVPGYWDGGIPWCTPTDITSNGDKYISKTARSISDAGLKNSAAILMPAHS